MRIALISDQHFDVSSRWEETLRLTDWIADDIARRDVDVVALGGDLFERRPVPFETRAAADWLIRLAAAAPVVGVYGNHDVDGSLDVFNKLDTVYGVTIYNRPIVHEVNGLAIACLPWPQKANILAMLPEASAEGAEQVATNALLHVLRGLGDQIRDHAGPKLFLGHVMVRGSRTSVGQPLCGCDFELGLTDLGLIGADAYLLGHIHCPQDWSLGKAPVIYPGSPRRTSYGETEAKGYVILDIDEAGNVAWEHVQTQATPMLLLETQWIGGSFESVFTPAQACGAEVRFRYQVDADQRDMAKASAATMRAELLEGGAIDVKIEEELTPSTRARAPEITTAESLAEQLEQLWSVQGFDPGERRQALLGKAADIEREEPASARRSGGIRLEALKLRNIGPVRDVAIDFDDFGDARIVAVTGPNGAGKSTTLEVAIPGAMYRRTPTRGTLGDLATSRDSMVEARLVNGSTWTIRHLLDAVSGKGESIVLDANGAPVNKSAKRQDFDRWAAEHLPAEDELFCTTFLSQGTAGFIGRTDGERKSRLLKVLGVSSLERLAERARKLANEKRNALSTIEARIADERGRGTASEQAAADLEAARQAVLDADAKLAELRAALQQAEKDAADAVRLAHQYAATRKARTELRQRITETETTLKGVQGRIANNKGVLADAARIRAAETELATLRERHTTISAAKAQADAEVTRLSQEIAALEARTTPIRERMKRTEPRLADRAKVDAAVAELPTLQAAHRDAEQAVTDAQATLRELQQHRLATVVDRVASLRDGLVGITQADNLEEAKDAAAGTLADDDAAVSEAEHLPQKLAGAEKGLATANAQLATSKQKLDAANTLAARQGEMVAAAAELDAARKELATIDLEGRSLVEPLARATSQAGRLKLELADIQADIERNEPIAKLAEPLARAEARLAELQPQLDAAQAELDDLNQRLAQNPEPPADPDAPDLEAARTVITEAEEHCRHAHAAVAVAEQTIEAVQQRDRHLAELTNERQSVEGDLADWARLGDDLGKDGLQALLIDAAGPEITARTNDLLHTCHGSRFSVVVNTQPLSADGKRALEGCEILVTDTVKGYMGEARTFSGGERVILGEALSLALAQIGCQRVGVQRPTLVRDESGAALDFENSRAYVAMLRRAADIVGADRVLIVTHSQDVLDLVDARVEIGKGSRSSEAPVAHAA